jgi:hypothetical protein
VIELVGLAAAVVVVASAVLAVSARDARVGIVGLTLASAATAVIADPLPGLIPLAFRIVAALFAGFLLWVTIRETDSRTGSTSLGWPAEAVAAAAAFVVGLAPSLLRSDQAGPAVAFAAGFALLVLAIVPVVFGRDAFRLGAGLLLLIDGASLLRVGIAGTPGPLEQLALGILVIGIAGATSVVALNAFAVSGTLDVGIGPGREDGT